MSSTIVRTKQLKSYPEFLGAKKYLAYVELEEIRKLRDLERFLRDMVFNGSMLTLGVSGIVSSTVIPTFIWAYNIMVSMRL